MSNYPPYNYNSYASYPQPGSYYPPPQGPPPAFNPPPGPPPIPAHSYPGGGPPPPQQYYSPPPGPPPSSGPPPGPSPGSFARPGYQNPVYIAPVPPSNSYAPGYAPPTGPPPPMAGAPPPLPSNHPGPSSGPISYFMNVAVPTPMGPHQPPPPVPGYDPTGDYERIRKATKGFGTDETAIITTLVPLDPIKLANLSTAFRTKSGKDLAAVLDKETSGNFKETLHGLALGPLWYDVELAKKATRGLGTNEQLLNEIVTDRTFDDLRLLSAAYQQQYGRSLFSEVEGDLSWKTKRVFEMILTNNRPPDHAHVDYGQVERDVTTLYKAGEGKGGTDEIAFCDIIVNRSRPHLTAVCDAYSRKYRSLSKAIKREFSGHMREVLLYYVHGANHKHINEGHGVWRDAKLLEASMKGMGTKDADLLRRIVRLHWDKQRFQAVKAAYHKKYKKSLDHRVSGETSGDYKKLLLAIINS